MAIQTFTNLAAAQAVPDPKHVWIDGAVIRVFTGEDIPLHAKPLTPDEAKAAAEKARTEEEAVAIMKDPKLLALAKMTPTEVRAWVQTSVKDLAQTHDALATLAVAVSVLSRRAL